jgi:predicted NBD/HSP70 family sugar kinase
MSDKASVSITHAAAILNRVIVDAYNAELRDAEGFIGDRASNRAFRAMIEGSRERVRDVADDPLGNTPTEDLSKKKLDKVLTEGDPEAAGVIHGAIEEFSSEVATVVTRLVKLNAWRSVERIVVGGGLRASRVGEIVIGRSSVLLKEAGHPIGLVPIHHHPDEAGLMGAVHLAPAWMLEGREGLLAVDIGGSNIRAGIVRLHGKKNPDGPKCEVAHMDLWRYADASGKPSREDVVARIVKMLSGLTSWAEKHDLELAPFVGVACPGLIAADGRIERGGQNLPGNWESDHFNLPCRIQEAVPQIADHDTVVVMHNDAVVQGLSEIYYMEDVNHWGVLTIGTGLGNAKFTNARGSSPR